MRRTGDKGAMRDLMKSADVAIANFENPAPNTFRWHTSGVVFSADRRNLEGLVRAGLDYVSIANNHIGDAGRNGVLQTIRNLDRVGLAHSGPARTSRRPANRRSSRRTGPRSRSSATTRSRATTTPAKAAPGAPR